jgi:hypothetical protein
MGLLVTCLLLYCREAWTSLCYSRMVWVCVPVPDYCGSDLLIDVRTTPALKTKNLVFPVKISKNLNFNHIYYTIWSCAAWRRTTHRRCAAAVLPWRGWWFGGSRCPRVGRGRCLGGSPISTSRFVEIYGGG